MRVLATALSRLSYVLTLVAVLLAPWLFGAWEAWWFWPFSLMVFLGAGCFAARLLIRADDTLESGGRWSQRVDHGSRAPGVALGGYLLFLLYAFVRFLQADVALDAERSFLLFLTPLLIVLPIVYGFQRSQLKTLYVLLLADLFLLGVYGIANHALTGSRLVMWCKGYPAYYEDGRASGTYYCPDHFAGIMELALSMALGVLLTRGLGVRRKAAVVVLGVLALVGIVLSKSRGGGLTTVFVGCVALVWGFAQWPRYYRWWYRVSIGAVAAIVVVVFAHSSIPYMVRFRSYFGWGDTRSRTRREVVDTAVRRLTRSGRGRMIAAALRAWRTQPVFGIGPGMHQNLWAHFAASEDGDREGGVWPSVTNTTFHSYEVHSDWVQFLEEYGIVGLLLFLFPAATVFWILDRALARETRDRERNDWGGTGRRDHAVVLGSLLAVACMAFHSLGDFNLQMPATVWLLATIVALALGVIRTDRVRRTRRRKRSLVPA